MARPLLWEAVAESFWDSPWLGFGVQNLQQLAPYRDRLVKTKNPRVRKKLARVFKRWGNAVTIHNNYLQVLFYTGVVGLLGYLSIWAGILFWTGFWIRVPGKIFPLETDILWGALGGLVASTFDGLFESNFFGGNAQTVMMTLIGLSLFAGLEVRRRSQDG